MTGAQNILLPIVNSTSKGREDMPEEFCWQMADARGKLKVSSRGCVQRLQKKVQGLVQSEGDA